MISGVSGNIEDAGRRSKNMEVRNFEPEDAEKLSQLIIQNLGMVQKRAESP